MLEIIIVDDDRVIINVLQRIISQYELGSVIGTASDGLTAETLIQSLRPQLVLVDLLLPGQDGISLVAKLKITCPKTRFIMLSQVNDKNMIGEAYQKGIEFFIHKPINTIEVVSVIQHARDLMQLKSAFEAIESTARTLSGERIDGHRPAQAPQYKVKLRQILTDIGIFGDLGSRDLILVCSLIHENPLIRKSPEEMQLAELFKVLQDKYFEESGTAIDGKAIEMRIRRCVSKALRNLAALGIDDFGHEKFITYSTSLFDYSDIKTEMDFLKGKTTSGGKVNIRAFIRRLIIMTDPLQENDFNYYE
jgi:two-component system response regulator YcbB